MITTYNKTGDFQIFVDIHEYCKQHRLLVEELDKNYVVGGHPSFQTRGSGFDDKMAFKFKVDFNKDTWNINILVRPIFI